MAITYYYGSVPVSREEAIEKKQVLESISTKNTGKLTFRNGSISYAELNNNKAIDLPEFTPIGINKPLSIEILTAYAGDVPRKFLGRKPDLMIVSGIKSYTTYGAAPKVINQLKSKVEDYSFMHIGAFDKGSPIVYYSPAVDSSTIFCSFELIADTFNRNNIQALSSLLGHAGKLPVFAPAAPFLLAGSQMMEMSSKLFNVLFESEPFMREDEAFRFDTPNVPVTMAKQMIVCNDSDQQTLMDYRPGLTNAPDGSSYPAMIHRKTEELYRGDAPYLLINLDGKKRPELESYTPKLATASIIEKFYGEKPNSGASYDILEDALKLYNDYNYSKKAKEMQEKMKSMSKRSRAYKRAKLLYEAYKSNIQSSRWKELVAGK